MPEDRTPPRRCSTDRTRSVRISGSQGSVLRWPWIPRRVREEVVGASLGFTAGPSGCSVGWVTPEGAVEKESDRLSGAVAGSGCAKSARRLGAAPPLEHLGGSHGHECSGCV